MTIQEIQTRKEDQTFDCKSIQIEPKALHWLSSLLHLRMPMVERLLLVYLIRRGR